MTWKKSTLSLTFSLNCLISLNSSGVISCFLVYVNEGRVELLVELESALVVDSGQLIELLPDFGLRDADIEEVI